MRLLFDENLPEALVEALSNDFPESIHVRMLGKSGISDHAVWQLAKLEQCTLITRDIDFQRLSAEYGAPPKLIYLKTNNPRKRELIAILQANIGSMRAFLESPELTMLLIDTSWTSK